MECQVFQSKWRDRPVSIVNTSPWFQRCWLQHIVLRLHNQTDVLLETWHIFRCVGLLKKGKSKGKGSPYSITERRVPELIPVPDLPRSRNENAWDRPPFRRRGNFFRRGEHCLWCGLYLNFLTLVYILVVELKRSNSALNQLLENQFKIYDYFTK